jgi:hypothetical protein
MNFTNHMSLDSTQYYRGFTVRRLGIYDSDGQIHWFVHNSLDSTKEEVLAQAVRIIDNHLRGEK